MRNITGISVFSLSSFPKRGPQTGGRWAKELFQARLRLTSYPIVNRDSTLASKLDCLIRGRVFD